MPKLIIVELMEYEDGLKKLSAIGQTHLLRFWDDLGNKDKENLLEQINRIDLAIFRNQQIALKTAEKKLDDHFEAVDQFAHAGNQTHFNVGKQLIAEGQVACILLAGGQGSRIRFEGPKGLFPVSVIKQKSLFQIFAEKTLAASKQANYPLSLAIMTSQINHKVTVKFFEDHDYFGLKSDQVSFFSQGSLPFLNLEGNLFLEEKGKIAEGPDGNGTVFKHFHESGILKSWKQKGVRFVNTVLIDNPLADPFDAELIGFHHEKKSQIVIKATQRRNETEKVGLIVKNKGLTRVVEYSEMGNAERSARDNKGELKHQCANLSLFSFSIDFLKEAALNKNMPLHPALKAVKSLEKDTTVLSEKPNAWKFEEFIFDILPFAQTVQVLLYKRETCFAPLKNLKGEDSLETVRESVQKLDSQIYSRITEQNPPSTAFELDQQFYYPTPQLLEKWKGRNFLPNDNNYIEP